MQNLYTVNVFKSLSSTSFVSIGFLKCVVKQDVPPFHSRVFAYCLECQKLRSLSWFYQHKKSIGFEPSSEMVKRFLAKYEMFVSEIITEVELLDDLGKLFDRPIREVRKLPEIISQ